MPAVPAAREIGPRERRHLLDYWAIVRRRRYVIAAIALLFTAAAVVRALTTPPVYSATAQLLIGRSAPQVLEFKEVMQIDSQGWGDEYHLTQLKLLASRTLARRAVERLGLANDAQYARRGDGGAPPDIEDVVDAFQGRVKARRLEHSQVFAVTVEAPRPELAAAGANAMAEVFIEEAARTRSQTNVPGQHVAGGADRRAAPQGAGGGGGPGAAGRGVRDREHRGAPRCCSTRS